MRFGRGRPRREGLLADAQRWAIEGIEYVQLREKDLDAGELLHLADAMLAVFRQHGALTKLLGARTKLLMNGRADVALAAGADGVHLTAHPDELTVEQVRRVFANAGARNPLISVSAHTVAEVRRAQEAGADLVLFGPVFEKRLQGVVVTPGSGLDLLREASAAAQGTPVFALGGVTPANMGKCADAGASGVAGIRLFQC